MTSALARTMGWLTDSLAKRLFLLLWVALVASHVMAYAVVHALHFQSPNAGFGARLPTFPSLPPTPGVPQGLAGPVGSPGEHRPGPPDGPPPHGQGGRPGERQGGNPDSGGPPPGPPPRNRDISDSGPTLPTDALLLDYGVRLFVIGLFAWYGSRWLAAPMRRLSQASRSLGNSVRGHTPLPALDEARGTREVREVASVFNNMAAQLHEQFQAAG